MLLRHDGEVSTIVLFIIIIKRPTSQNAHPHSHVS